MNAEIAWGETCRMRNALLTNMLSILCQQSRTVLLQRRKGLHTTAKSVCWNRWDPNISISMITTPMFFETPARVVSKTRTVSHFPTVSCTYLLVGVRMASAERSVISKVSKSIRSAVGVRGRDWSSGERIAPETDPDNALWSWDPTNSLLEKNTKHSRRDERNGAECTFLSKEFRAWPLITAQKEMKKLSRGIPVLEDDAMTC